MECARSQFFSEPELFVDILARHLGAVTETRFRKVTVQEEKFHFLANVADGGVDRLHLQCTQLVRKITESLETRQLLVEGTHVRRHLRNLRRYRFPDRRTPLKFDEPQ